MRTQSLVSPNALFRLLTRCCAQGSVPPRRWWTTRRSAACPWCRPPLVGLRGPTLTRRLCSPRGCRRSTLWPPCAWPPAANPDNGQGGALPSRCRREWRERWRGSVDVVFEQPKGNAYCSKRNGIHSRDASLFLSHFHRRPNAVRRGGALESLCAQIMGSDRMDRFRRRRSHNLAVGVQIGILYAPLCRQGHGLSSKAVTCSIARCINYLSSANIFFS